jgi:hypothetical protein
MVLNTMDGCPWWPHLASLADANGAACKRDACTDDEVDASQHARVKHEPSL